MARGAGQGSVGPQGLWGKGELGSWSERAHNPIAQETAITAARFRLAPHFCAVPLAAPEPQWGGYWGQGRRVRAKIRPPSSRKQLAGHCRAAAAR